MEEIKKIGRKNRAETKALDAEAQVIPLSETTGMLRQIAQGMLNIHRVYRCMVDGKPVKVVRG